MGIRLLLVIAVLLAGAAMSSGCLFPESIEPTALPTATLTMTPTPATPSATPAPSATSTPATGTPQPTPSTPTPPEVPESDIDAAVQAILNYYLAINDERYQQAYDYWSGNGEASNQTLDEFTEGYANTVRVTVQLGMPAGRGTATGVSVTVPITLTSIVNRSAAEQAVEHYQGTYTLQPGASAAAGSTGWVIESASINEIEGAALPPPDVADPVILLESYYEAINQRQFARAYTYWDNLGQASGQTFGQFRSGFVTTEQVTVEIGEPREGAAAGSVYAEVPVAVTAAQTDGAIKGFAGTYTLRRLNVPPFDQFGWRIEGASLEVR